jgi:hypothetical protein
MTDLTLTLERILVWLQNNNLDYASSLQDGLTRLEIDIKSQELPFRLPEEIYELFQWRNGSQEELYAPFSPTLSFLSLENAVEIADWYSDEPDLGGKRYKGKMLFPFTGAQKTFYAVVINSETEDAQVALTDTEDDRTQLVSLSVNRFLITALECLETLPFDLCNSDENYKIVAEIARKHNPEIVDEALRIVVEVEPQHLGNKCFDEYHLFYCRFTEACETSIYFEDRRVLEPLIRLLYTGELHSNVSALIISVVGRIGDSREIETVQSFINHNDGFIRGAAIHTLRNLRFRLQGLS